MIADRRVIIRRRVLAALVALIVLAAVIIALVLVLGGGGGEPPPASAAAGLVPADALAYANLSTDSSRPGVRRMQALERRLPALALLAGGLRSRIDSVAGGRGSVDVSSWLGREAAVAVLDTSSSTADLLILADVAHSGAARQALISSGATESTSYRGHVLWRLPSGNEAAFTGRFLAVGADASVRAALDVAAGAAPSLARYSEFQRAASGEPDGRFVDLYASAPGVRRLLEARHDAAGVLGIFLDQPALSAVSLSATAQSPGLRVSIHTVLDSRLAHLQARPKTYEPSLPSAVPSGSALMLDTQGLRNVGSRLLAASAATGVAGRSGPLLARLGSALTAEGVNVNSVLSVFSGETSVVVGAPPGQSPAVTIMSRTSDPETARETLANLAIPLAQLFPSGTSSAGTNSLITDHQIGSVTVHQVSLTPGLNLYYTVDGNQVMVSTSLGAMQTLLQHRRGVTGDPAYQATVSSGSSRVTSVLFLDFSQLLNLGEQTGLAQGASLSALRTELQGVRAAGLVSTGGETDSNAELLVQIP